MPRYKVNKLPKWNNHPWRLTAVCVIQTWRIRTVCFKKISRPGRLLSGSLTARCTQRPWHGGTGPSVNKGLSQEESRRWEPSHPLLTAFPGTRPCLLKGRDNTFQAAQMGPSALDEVSQGQSSKSWVSFRIPHLLHHVGAEVTPMSKVVWTAD